MRVFVGLLMRVFVGILMRVCVGLLNPITLFSSGKTFSRQSLTYT
jgi:hypothetical protein